MSSLPAEAFRSVFGGGKLRYPDTARIIEKCYPCAWVILLPMSQDDNFAGAAGWRPAVVAAALSAGSARRSIGAAAGRGVPGRPVAGRGDRAVLPNFAGAAGWRPAVVAAALSAGSARRSIGAPGHNDDRSRTPRHSRPPGRTSAAGALRRSPSPPFWRDSTTATRHGNLDPICRCPFYPPRR